MGVLNVTPDSFSDGGRFFSLESATVQAGRLFAEGADIIDVGGESSRPGASDVSVDEELSRVIPVIEAIRANCGVEISVDTSKPKIMAAAIRAGASWVNDIRALSEPGAISVAARTGVRVCLMHMRGTPRTMQGAPRYVDVVGEVGSFLQARVEACLQGGVRRENIVIDPGFGFGKTPAHNLELVKGIGFLSQTAPVLLGVSRKSTLGVITGDVSGDRLSPSLALAVLAAQAGVAYLRVHDVLATVEALKILAALEEVSAYVRR